ncbi:MAG: homoserine kinase, partial [Planctomycetota bacterium]
PGFDLCGLALDLNLQLRAQVLPPADASAPASHRLLEATGEAQSWPEDPSRNLLFRAFDRGLEAHGLPAASLQVSVHSDIPTERGFGSSGAAVAAGLLLAAAQARASEARVLDRQRLAELGLSLEGHPDNSTASLFGGCTLGVPLDGDRLRIVRPPIAESLSLAIAWPEHRVSTKEARRVLPQTVEFATAVENPRRLTLLLEGLRTADPELLREGIRDNLHVPYRLPLIPGAEQALAAAREAGAYAATISGSGSGLVALTSNDVALQERVASAMKAELERFGDSPAVGRAAAIQREAPRAIKDPE